QNDLPIRHLSLQYLADTQACVGKDATGLIVQLACDREDLSADNCPRTDYQIVISGNCEGGRVSASGTAKGSADCQQSDAGFQVCWHLASLKEPANDIVRRIESAS